jgi:AraC-like DNA-binding protein
LVVQAIRAWLAIQPPGTGGWLGALRDPPIGSALALMHKSPERAWTVPALAAEVGMSRSAFATRFTELVGTPPLSYLQRWRLQLAADLIRTRSLPLAVIAERAGYTSIEGFSRSFKRQFGRSPAAFRRQKPSA